MSNQQLYNTHRANGVPHDEAAAALGVSNDQARMLKSRYNKANNPGISTPRKAKAVLEDWRKANPALIDEYHLHVEPKHERPAVVRKSRTPETSATNRNYRSVALVALLIAPTAASVQNAYHVSGQIMGDVFGAVCMTVVLSLTALGLVFSGARSWVTLSLAVLLIGFESFCNLTRIYSGLMIGGKFGTSEFLGRVCDIFNSGSHYTAVCLGGLTALLLAAVQYVTIFELNKKS